MTAIDRVIRIPVSYDHLIKIWNYPRNNDFWADLNFIELERNKFYEFK